MTDAAFKKRRLRTYQAFADSYTKAVYGMYPNDMIEAMNIAHAKKAVLIENDSILKEQYVAQRKEKNIQKQKDKALQQLIIYLHIEQGKTHEAIAIIAKMPKETIEWIIFDYNVSKDYAENPYSKDYRPKGNNDEMLPFLKL